MNNKGFVASSLIYSFFVAILLLMTLTINNYIQNENISSKFSEKVRENIDNPKPIVTPQSKPAIEELGDELNLPDDIPTPTVTEQEAPAGSTCTNTLAGDGEYGNKRYVGANPCNYVSFNGESPTPVTIWTMKITSTGANAGFIFESKSDCEAQMDLWEADGVEENFYTCYSMEMGKGGWRIIGFVNDVVYGNPVYKIKLIRNEPLGEYSWDSSDESINDGYGINDWIQSDIMKELNTDYLNTALTTNTTWYNGPKNQKTGVYDYTKGIKGPYQNLISGTTWYLGSKITDEWTDGGDAGTLTAKKWRQAEQNGYLQGTVWGETSGQTCDDGYCPRSRNWIGKVGLAYPSDYGFAVGGAQRSICLETNLDMYRNDGCFNNNWMYYWFQSSIKGSVELCKKCVNGSSFLITPSANTAKDVKIVNLIGGVSRTEAWVPYAVRPVVYLKPNVSLASGDGSVENPYVFSLN